MRPAVEKAHVGWRRGAMIALLIGVCYLLAAWLAIGAFSQPSGVAIFWPAAGLPVGAQIALGRSARLPSVIGVAVAALTANYLAWASLPLALAFVLFNIADCLLAPALIRLLNRSEHLFDSLSGVIAFFAGTLLATGMSSLPGALLVQLLLTPDSTLPEMWFQWFRSTAFGMTTVAPLVVTLIEIWRSPPASRVLLEGLAALTVMVAVSGYSLAWQLGEAAWLITPGMVLFPMFLWLTSRLPPVFSAISIAIFSVIAVQYALNAYGRFGGPSVPLADRILAAQIVSVVASFCLLTLASSFARIRNFASALATSDLRLRTALDFAGLYAFDYDLRTGVVHRVGSLAWKLGLPPEGTIEDYAGRLVQDDRSALLEMIATRTPAAPQFVRQFRVRAPDGSVLHLMDRAKAMFDAGGNPVRIVGVCIDSTERQQSEDALRDREQRLSEALENGRVVAFDWDFATGAVTRSQNAVDILGLAPDRINMSRSELVQLIHPEDREIGAQAVAELTPECPTSSYVARFLRPDGQLVWLSILLGGTFDETGKLTRVRGLTRDITERKLAEDHNTWLIGQLNHRVKNLLSAFRIAIERTRESHRTLDDFEATLKARVSSMTRTHRRLSRNLWEGVSLGALVEDEVEPYKTEHNTTCEGPEVLLLARAASAIGITLHELATNAAKYGALADPDGSVTVRWSIDYDGGKRVLRLVWHEHVPRGISDAGPDSYGVSTIKGLARHEIGATTDYRHTPQGVRFELVALAARAIAPPSSHAGGQSTGPDHPASGSPTRHR